MSKTSGARATESGANAAVGDRVRSARSAIASILRETPAGPPRHVVTPATRAALAGRLENAKQRSRAEAALEGQTARDSAPTKGIRRRAGGGRGKNPTQGVAHRLSASERRAQMLERNATRPARGEFNGQWKAGRQHGRPGEHAYQETRVQPNMRTKPETATARAIREGATREPTGATHSALIPARGLPTRTTLPAKEADAYRWLRQNTERFHQQIDEYTQLEQRAHATLANPRASAEDRQEAHQDIPYARIQARAARAQLDYLDHLESKKNAGKVAAKAAREAKLAPLRAHLAGLKAASRNGAEGVNDWLAQKYPGMAPMLNRANSENGEKPLSATVARKIAASFAILQREFPSAGARIAALGINHSSDAPGGLIHSTRRLSDGFLAGTERGQRAIGVSPSLGKRGALKGAERGANGKPMSVEALMRQAFAPAVERDLQALPTDSEGGKAYAKWRASYPSADFARSFTHIAYGRGGKGQRGAGRSPEVRALKRALRVAYPTANLTQKPIAPKE